jgi:hypothetical protein
MERWELRLGLRHDGFGVCQSEGCQNVGKVDGGESLLYMQASKNVLVWRSLQEGIRRQSKSQSCGVAELWLEVELSRNRCLENTCCQPRDYDTEGLSPVCVQNISSERN